MFHLPRANTGSLLQWLHLSQHSGALTCGPTCRRLSGSDSEAFFPPQCFVFFPVARRSGSDVMAALGGASLLNSWSVCFPPESPSETLGIWQITDAY